MTRMHPFPKLALLACLALALAASATYLVAAEAETALEIAQTELCSEPAAEAAADELTFPVSPWFDGPTVLIPAPQQIECIPGGTCNADWQCGGPSRGYCKAVPGHCVCL